LPAAQIQEEALNEDVLNVKLLRDIENFYDKSDIKNVDFSLVALNETREVVSQNITKAQIHRLTLFIDEVNNRTFETKTVTVRGKIDQLKSRDPDGGKNSITLQGMLDDMPVVATANLASETYKQAIEAHRIKEYITIAGMAKTTKTRIRFIDVESFQIG
jgi:hypothetical protein